MSDIQLKYNDIFHAILSMDVYHRGVNSGLKPLDNVTKVGTATVVRDSQDESLSRENRLEAKFGFVAFEYEDSASGKTIYAYRGTDRGFSGDVSVNDRLYGFTTTLGLPNAEQLIAALDFYQQGNTDNEDSIVIGQSLGGGIAGFVSGVNNIEASIFSNMPFNLAVENFIGLVNGSKTKEDVTQSITDRVLFLGDQFGAQYFLAGIAALPVFGLPGTVIQAILLGAATPTVVELIDVISEAIAELDVEALRETYFEDEDGDGEIDFPSSFNLAGQISNNVSAFSLEDELLGVLSRSRLDSNNFETEIPILGELRQDNTPSFFDTNDLITFVSDAIGIEELAERHTSSPLIIRMFGELSQDQGGAGIDDITRDFWPNIWAGLYNPDVAKSTGIDLAEVSNNGNEGRDAEAITEHFAIQVMLAYSALNEGGLVFGDTGIRSLYNDAGDLGRIFDTDNDVTRNPFLDGDLNDTGIVDLSLDTSIMQALSDIAVQYAGALALNKVSRSDIEVSQIIVENDEIGTGDLLEFGDGTDGVIRISDDGSVLALDLSSVLWKDVLETSGSTLNAPLEPIHKDALLREFISQAQVNEEGATKEFSFFRAGVVEDLDKIAQEFWGAADRSIFDRLHIRTTTDLTEVTLAERVYDRNKNPNETHVDVYVGHQTEDNTITGTTGDDLIFGGLGVDTLYTNGGNDIIFGQEESDIIVAELPDLADLGIDFTTIGSIGRTFIGKNRDTSESLEETFFRWWEGDRDNPNLEQDMLLYSSGSLTGIVPDYGYEIDGLELKEDAAFGSAIGIELKELGSSDNPLINDTLIGIDRTKFTWRRDVVNVTDASLQSPILLDLGGFAPDEVLESDFDEVDYSQLSRGITYVNGTTRFADEGDEGRNSSLGVSDLLPYLFGATPDFLSFGDQRENDALRVTGAENITATDHDDTLWFGQVGLLQSLLSGWPADLGASPFGTIDAGDGNDLIAFTGADVVLADDLIPEEYGGEAQTPNPETGELDGGSIAAEQLRVTIDGGKGDDYILARGGTGAITIGGEGRDFIFNTSEFGQIYGNYIKFQPIFSDNFVRFSSLHLG